MNRGEFQDLFNWAVDEVWPNHLGQDIPEWRQRVEACAITAEFYAKRRDEGNSHEDAKHRVFEDIMELAGRRPPLPTSTILAIAGQLRVVNDSTFSDDTGPRCVSMLHAGNMYHEWLKDEDKAKRFLDLCVKYGYHGPRWWTRCRGNWWQRNDGEWGQEITPRYWERMRAFIQAHVDRGLVFHTGAGDLRFLGESAENDYIDGMAALAQEFPQAFALFEYVNEARDTDDEDSPRDALNDMTRFRQKCPQVLTALSAYTGHEDKTVFGQWTAPWMAFVQVHVGRDGRWWDKIRHLYSLPYEDRTRRLWWHGEPWGVGSRVSASTPSAMAELTRDVYGLAAWQVAITGGVWTDFFSPGVILGDERFEDFPQFGIAPKMAATAERFGREHGISWGQLRLMHGGAGRRNILTIASGGEHARIDQAIDDAKGVCFATVYGPEAISAKPTPGWMWTWVNPATAEVVENIDVTRSMKPGGLVGVRK